MKNRWPIIMPVVFCTAAIGLWVYPVETTVTRAALLVAICAGFVSAAAIFRKRRLARLAFAVIAGLVVLPLAMPGRDVNVGRLRERYVSALRSYDGTLYVWGGEGRLGIDCSGLPRKAYRDALLAEGLTTLNGRLVRECFLLWWFDANANGFTQGHRGYLTSLGIAGPIRDVEPTLQPGDIAVTVPPVHVLVYLGDGQWIQADPGPGKVFITGREDNKGNGRESVVTAYRWSELNVRQ